MGLLIAGLSGFMLVLIDFFRAKTLKNFSELSSEDNCAATLQENPALRVGEKRAGQNA